MDRNEVLLVGRLSAAPEDQTLPSGDIVTKWRIIVRRRRRQRRGVTTTDSIPCVTFSPETADVIRSLKPRDYLEVTGSFRCRVFGPPGGKIWKYEVEVTGAKPVDVTVVRGDPPAEDGAAAAETAATVTPLVPRRMLQLAKAS
ncbi:single-stranded DNA-binding protein [Actinomadura sp. ATCC 31491]|uniref:Single-stranded DNA-binding protein n=1 Tax=Actinomadura luzonensis TaxID=2805427 RepID=A0ABT0FWU4_9ACTN|nr:single-stranded DNA-binding protein [Actinomadura luzonensis]MCK2216633.1 single-stranded DNA-binding protein [Actinomadura luzonensis]